MKRIAVFTFSLVLIYGGVAWALATCLSLDDQHQHSSADRESHHHGPTIVDDSQDSSRTIIHCPTAEIRIGPLVQSGSARFQHAQRAATNHSAWFYEPAQPRLGNGRWLDAVFRPILAFSQAGDAGRYLLFSVLQI